LERRSQESAFGSQKSGVRSQNKAPYVRGDRYQGSSRLEKCYPLRRGHRRLPFPNCLF
jgi:hypothetical protein